MCITTKLNTLQDPLDLVDLLELEVKLDQQVLQDLLDQLVHLVHQENLVLVHLDLLDPKDNLEQMVALDPKDLLDHQDQSGRQDLLVLLVPEERLEQEANLEPMVNQVYRVKSTYSTILYFKH